MKSKLDKNSKMPQILIIKDGGYEVVLRKKFLGIFGYWKVLKWFPSMGAAQTYLIEITTNE